MKSTDLNKLKLYKSLTIILSFFLIISTLLSILTSGFSVWDRFSQKDTAKPLFVLRVEPLVIKYEDAYKANRENVSLYFEIETSGGTYKIGKGTRIDSLVLLKKQFFSPSLGVPKIELTDFGLDKILLGPSYPNIDGIFKFKCHFVLDAASMIDMSDGQEMEVAYFNLYFPYEFEGKNYIEKYRIPLIIKK